MKRTALVAIMIAALAFGAVGHAIANTADVDVTARVNPRIQLTVYEDTVAFGDVYPGNDYTEAVAPQVRVRSNVPYNLSRIDDGSALAAFLTDDLAVGDYGRGVRNFDVTYELDLTPDAAFDLVPDDYTAVVTYTAVQN